MDDEAVGTSRRRQPSVVVPRARVALRDHEHGCIGGERRARRDESVQREVEEASDRIGAVGRAGSSRRLHRMVARSREVGPSAHRLAGSGHRGRPRRGLVHRRQVVGVQRRDKTGRDRVGDGKSPLGSKPGLDPESLGVAQGTREHHDLGYLGVGVLAAVVDGQAVWSRDAVGVGDLHDAVHGEVAVGRSATDHGRHHAPGGGVGRTRIGHPAVEVGDSLQVAVPSEEPVVPDRRKDAPGGGGAGAGHVDDGGWRAEVVRLTHPLARGEAQNRFRETR